MAQFGRALRSGRRGRGFESRRFDSLAGAPESFEKIPVLFLFKMIEYGEYMIFKRVLINECLCK